MDNMDTDFYEGQVIPFDVENLVGEEVQGPSVVKDVGENLLGIEDLYTGYHAVRKIDVLERKGD